MILKAFRIITKGVGFLDIYDEDRRSRYPTISMMANVLEETLIPPTPPADQSTFDTRTEASGSQESQSEANTAETTSDIVSCQPPQAAQLTVAPTTRRLSVISSPPAMASHRHSQASTLGHRLSANVSHRHSLAGPSAVSKPHNLVSEQMSRTHDILLSQLGSLIGRLHLQSQSIPDLVRAIKVSASSGGKLLCVVDLISAHDGISREMLYAVRATLFERVQALIHAGQDIIVYAKTDDAEVVMPEHTMMMTSAATGCVRAAGECVERTTSVIARVGDFEARPEEGVVGVDVSVLDFTPERTPPSTPSAACHAESGADMITDSTATSAAATPTESSEKTLPPTNLTPVDKPLPDVPMGGRSPMDEMFLPQSEESQSVSHSRPSTAGTDSSPSMVSSVSSLRPAVPPLPKLATTLLPPTNYTTTNDNTITGVDFQPSSRYEGMTASSAGSTSTYLSQDSESGVISHTSTRATTPDHTLGPKNQPSMSELSAAGSAAHSEGLEEVECKILEKTYAHELVFNKEGQVTGGSLPALVERLTAHESTPDAMFVSTFYLTFRLFCRPAQLAQTLVDRFEYVVDAPHMTSPVRLRVYNVFKGWLESHWRDETDREALDLIVPFAEVTLASVIPSAGRRLLELAQRVSKQGSLVPRHVSSIGKANTPPGPYMPDAPVPSPNISKSQLSSLLSWKAGGASPTVLDFDPVELARQLTIKQMSIFSSIQPEELLASQWMKNGGADAPNVKAMTALSTDLSNLVAETILHYSEVKKRAAVIKQWIKIAHQCYELHNYDGLMAIICSLNSSTISRLRKTWDAISHKRRDMLQTLQAVVEPSQNNKVLRGRLHDHVPPCLPFLGMYLTDLTFVDIGNAATKQLHGFGSEGEDESNGFAVVNFDKHTRTAKIIGELQRFQIPYRLQEVPEMQDWMGTQVGRVRLTEPDNVQVSYYRKSLLLEPREITAARAASDNASLVNGATSTAQRGPADLFGWIRDRQAAPS